MPPTKAHVINFEECERMRELCNVRLTEVKDDMRLIKSALVGTDLRGGLVNQVNTLTSKISDIVATQKLTDEARNTEKIEEKKLSQTSKDKRDDIIARYKVALIGVLGTLFGIVLGYLLNML